MSDVRKLAAILAADVAGYSRLAGADEDRTLARLRALRSDLIDPTVALHNGRVVKRDDATLHVTAVPGGRTPVGWQPHPPGVSGRKHLTAAFPRLPEYVP